MKCLLQKGNGDAATIFYGTLSGGLSAELTGGNFWQGAATGLVVSGLNHVAHKIRYRNFVYERLDAIGRCDDDIPNQNIDEVHYLVNNDPTLNSMYTDGNSPNMRLDLNATKAGTIPATASSIKSKTVNEIIFGSKAYKSYYTLYQTIGHELRHAVQIVSGTFANTLKLNNGNMNKTIYMMEVDALYWNYTQYMGDLQWFDLMAEYEQKLLNQ